MSRAVIPAAAGYEAGEFLPACHSSMSVGRLTFLPIVAWLIIDEEAADEDGWIKVFPLSAGECNCAEGFGAYPIIRDPNGIITKGNQRWCSEREAIDALDQDALEEQERALARLQEDEGAATQ